MAGVRDFEFQIKGLRELMRTLDSFPEKVSGRRLRDATREAIAPALAMARATIPQGRGGENGVEHYVLRNIKRGKEGYKVRSPFALGQLKLKTKTGPDKLSAYTLLGVKKPAFYALSFVELGTSTQAKQPWLRPAFLQTASQQLSIMKTKFQRNIRNEARKAAKLTETGVKS